MQLASPQLIKILEEKGGAGTAHDVTLLRLWWMDGGYKPLDAVEGHVMAYEEELARRWAVLWGGGVGGWVGGWVLCGGGCGQVGGGCCGWVRGSDVRPKTPLPTLPPAPLPGTRGDVEAHRQLGYRMLVGQGMARDLAGAVRELGIAAEGGDAFAMFNLGFMHVRGMGVPVNLTRAREVRTARGGGWAVGLGWRGGGMPSLRHPRLSTARPPLPNQRPQLTTHPPTNTHPPPQYFEEASARGLASAHNGLGVMYFHGQVGGVGGVGAEG